MLIPFSRAQTLLLKGLGNEYAGGLNMNENTRLLLASLAIGGVVFLSDLIFGQLLHLHDSEARLTSLGVPKVIPLDPSKGEQKVTGNDPSIQQSWGLNGSGGASDSQ